MSANLAQSGNSEAPVAANFQNFLIRRRSLTLSVSTYVLHDLPRPRSFSLPFRYFVFHVGVQLRP
jgi:hypothetical protein